ncbi:MAG: hypothetical protein NTX84_10130 [Nitrospirae bacterium]|nr:hypothetical protein [Nitrospirota bacterium]
MHDARAILAISIEGSLKQARINRAAVDLHDEFKFLLLCGAVIGLSGYEILVGSQRVRLHGFGSAGKAIGKKGQGCPAEIARKTARRRRA